jgi:hypothetical protein
MRLLVAVACAALLSGCSHTSVGVNAGTTVQGGGTTVASNRTGLHVQASNGAALAIVIIALIAGSADYDKDRPPADPRALIPENTPPVPGLAPGRTVSEQDCSKPLTDFTGNLKCR